MSVHNVCTQCLYLHHNGNFSFILTLLNFLYCVQRDRKIASGGHVGNIMSSVNRLTMVGGWWDCLLGISPELGPVGSVPAEPTDQLQSFTLLK